MRHAILGLVGLFTACATPTPVGSIRFHATSPVWRVNDRVAQPIMPEGRGFYHYIYILDGAVTRRATRAMELHKAKPVTDINSLDEVPDSTWFVNRIGARALTLEELKRGPNVHDSPFDHRPWTITGAKVGGRSLGFTFEDALHRKFLVKFDRRDIPETETAAHVIVSHILWACGYNVPEDEVGYIQRSDLVVGDKARAKGFDEVKLDAALKLVEQRRDGAVRVLTSLFVPGKTIGPYAREGVRADDANDLIPHERRRSLRGQYPIFAWLDHTDMKEDNTLDAFENGYVTHYLIDFGKALGVMGTTDQDASNGYRYLYDIPSAFADLLTLGLRTHPWDRVRQPPLRGVGLYDVENFEPARWRPLLPYWPLSDSDKFDAFWGAKLIMRFKPHELAAIVDEAKLSDPRAAKYVVDTLVKRQRKTARYWFDRVAPLDAFGVDAAGDGARLCFTDLMLEYLLRDSPATYAIDTYDHDGKATGFAQTIASTPRGRSCVQIPLSSKADGYTIVRLRLRREGRELPPVVVHIARIDGGRLDVIGLRRR